MIGDTFGRRLPFASVLPDEAHSYPVEFQIQEGIQSVVERILVLGNERTRSSVIKKRIQLKENEPLSLGKLLQTQQALYGLGVFDQVRVAPQNPESASPYQNVVVRLQESKRFTMRYGLGLSGKRKAAGYHRIHTSEYFRPGAARANPTSREQHRTAGALQPSAAPIPPSTRGFLFHLFHPAKRRVSFDSRRFNLSYQFSHPFGDHAWGMLRYNFKNVRILNSLIPESELGRENSPATFRLFPQLLSMIRGMTIWIRQKVFFPRPTLALRRGC